VSKQIDFVEVAADGRPVGAGAAPYLDYRAPTEDELKAAQSVLTAEWVSPDLERVAEQYAIESVVQHHYEKVRTERDELVLKTMAAVRDRLTKEIQYWDHRAEDLKRQELAGRTPRINSGNARRRCEELEARLQNRTRELEAERDMSASPPIIRGGCLVIPARVVAPAGSPMTPPKSTKETEVAAMAAVMDFERKAGRTPVDVSKENRGWDIESADGTGRLRFIEVKGRRPDAETVCISRNEWLTAMNKRGDYYLAIAIVDNGRVTDLHMVADPRKGSHEFAITSVNIDIKALITAGAD